MKTRIVYPTLWDDECVLNLSKDGKVLLFNLLTSPRLGVSNVLKVSDRSLLTETGLNKNELEKAVGEVQSCGIFRFEGWFLLDCDQLAYVNYLGNENVAHAKEKELSAIPTDILTGLQCVKDGSALGQRPNINYKSEIINHKLGGVGEKKKFSVPEDLTEEELLRIAEGKKISLRDTKLYLEQLKGWKDSNKIKDWNLTLRGWIARGIQEGRIKQVVDPLPTPYQGVELDKKEYTPEMARLAQKTREELSRKLAM